MDVKEIMEFFSNEENKEQVEKIRSSLGWVTKDNLSGLEANKNQLLAEKKDLQKKLKAFEEVDLDKYDEFLDFLDKKNLTDGQKSSKMGSNDNSLAEKKHQRELQRMQRQLEELTAERQTLNGQLSEMVVKNSLTSMFDEFKVDPKHRPILQAALRANIKVEDSASGKPELLFNSPEGEVSLKTHLDKFFSGEGSVYITKPVNAGGGAIGGSVNAGSGSKFEESLKNKDFMSAIRSAKTK